jgi:hypothetical protein
MIYTYPSFWRSAMADSHAFHAYPLWIAHWSTMTPSVPGGWPTWTMHQYSATGRVSGISGDVDLDQFHGTATQLYAFAHPGTHPTASTTGPIAYRGSGWRFSGRLATERGAAVPDTTVRLYRAATTTGPWSLLATTRTDGSGDYRFVVHPSAAASYKVRFSGSTTLASSWSAVRSHAIRDRSVTRLTSTASATTIRRGGSMRLTGTLSSASGWRLGGRALTVQSRIGTRPWTAVTVIHTSLSTGRYAVTLRPQRTTQYRLSYAGSMGTLPTTSAGTTVHVR